MIQLKRIHPEDVSYIYYLLENTRFPMLTNKMGRAKQFGPHRSLILGYVRQRFSGKYAISVNTPKNQELYDELIHLGNKIVPFEFTSIHINKNVVCPPHIDGKNVGNSVIVSIGDYEGCDLSIKDKEGKEHIFNTNLHPIMFNGSELQHWNTPIKKGTKYSIVYYNYNTFNSTTRESNN